MNYALVLKQCLAIGLAGFAGALARVLASTLLGRWFGTAFPVGILVVNVSGCFLLGFFLAAAGDRATETTKLAVAAGFLGAYTTFSTWLYDTNALYERGEVAKAVLNLVLSIALGIAAVRLGLALGRRM